MENLQQQIAALPAMVVAGVSYLSYRKVTDAVAAFLFPAHPLDQIDAAAYQGILETSDALCHQLGYQEVVKLTPPAIPFSDMGLYWSAAPSPPAAPAETPKTDIVYVGPGQVEMMQEGLLLDARLSQLGLDEVTRQHFNIPVTASEGVIALLHRAVQSPWLNDYKGIWHDILGMCIAGGKDVNATERHFTVIIRGLGQRRYWRFKAQLRQDSVGAPFLLVCLAEEWDRAGLVSRRMLRQMVLSAADLPPAKRERLEAELRHARRVEFTVMTERGQDKGHAIVADDLRDEEGRPVDFLLPKDTKREVRLTNDHTFVGLSFVHGHNHMRLDIQSLINLHPFFQEKQLLDWLKDEGELFVQAVETGQVAEVMGRIDRHTTLEEVQAWPLREYLASGGQPMWFRSHVKSLLNQHLRRLNASTLEKMRLPIPGGRHYVMPASVGQRAGILHLNVPPGHIHVDPDSGTAWVNDVDWFCLPDSPTGVGIAGILGGADNDDALWLHPFTDRDGARKVLAWRSPNQVGEYVILQPTADSHPLPWPTAAGEASLYPPADSRQLPPRVDWTETAYLGLVDAQTAGSLGEGAAYSVAVMDAAIARALANQGALGMYCNALMLNKALYGRLPDHPPAPLEAIIDSAVKTGADLSRVVSWNYANSRQILESRTPIPAILHQRLSIDWADKENRPPLPRVSGMSGNKTHWLDRLETGVKTHIQVMQAKRDELVAQACSPQAVLDVAVTDPEAVKLGAGLNKAYAVALRTGKKGEHTNVLERARHAAEDYLAHFPPERRRAILLGALASVYSKEKPGSDAAVWLAGNKDETKPPWPGIGETSIVHETIVALRGIGLLDDILVTKEGLVVYPAELGRFGVG